MKQKFTSIFLLLAALFVCAQGVWAKQGDKTNYQISWSSSDLNSITSNQFLKTAQNGLLDIHLYGGIGVKYNDGFDGTNYMKKGWGRLDFGDFARDTRSYTIEWPMKQAGYTVSMTKIRALARSYVANASDAYMQFDNEQEVNIGHNAYNTTTEVVTSKVPTGASSVGFKLRRDRAAERLMVINKLEFSCDIVPNAPTWSPVTDNVKVTVNHTEDAYLHWIDLSSYLQIANSYFAGSVKYEAVGLDAKYIVWNSTHDKCYIIKPGTYQFRAYIDKVDGTYSSSAYTATNLTLTAAADPAEQANAQIFYMVDDVLATEVDDLNHVWEVSIVGPSTNHYTEYVYAYEGNMSFEQRTEFAVKYLQKTEIRKDNFNMSSYIGMDSVIAKIDGFEATRSWLRINAVKPGNHVTFHINSQEMFDRMVTSVSTQEGKDVFWDNNRIRFAHFDDDYSRKRTMEVTFTGVPDSLIMLYGNNSEWQSNNAKLSIEYYDGSWHDFQTISGRPDNSSDDKAVRFAYQLPAGAQKLRFAYWGAQNMGFIHDLTVTERAGFKMSEPIWDASTDKSILLTGLRQNGGVESKAIALQWYNLYPSFQDTLTQYNTDRFTVARSGINTELGLDKYQENCNVNIGLKLDSAGVFYTYYMVWNGSKDPSFLPPGGKYVYGLKFKGVVKYNASDLKIENNLVGDTTTLTQGSTLPNPFQLTDSTGNPITDKVITDSLFYNYEVLPADNVEIDNEGNILAKCVGLTRVIATSKGNSLIPAGVADTLYIYVDEKAPNKITWNIPDQIGINDVITDLAVAEDSAAITYTFIPDNATQLADNKVKIGNVVGDMFVTATSAKNCAHFANDSTVIIKVLNVLNDDQVITKPDSLLTDLLPGDSIKDLITVFDEQGDTLVPPAIQTTYKFIPDSAAAVVDGTIIVLKHAVDITVIATTTGIGIKTRIDTIYLHVDHDWEDIQFTSAMPKTMLVGKEYALAQYLTVKSGNGVDSLYLAKAMETKAVFNQGKRSIVPKDSAKVVIYAKANGNDDYWGPDVDSCKVTFLYGVNDIDWIGQIPQDLNDLKIVDDTIRTSNVPVTDNNGKDITSEITKTYEIIPNPTGNAEVTPEGDIVMTQAGDVKVIITVSGNGFETKKDTLYMHAEGYTVDTVDLGADLSNLHIGDLISLSNVKVYDTEGDDITNTQVDGISYIIKPSQMATYNQAGNYIEVKKAGQFAIIPVVTGALLDPNPAYDTIYASAVGYKIDTVDLCTNLSNLHIGDTISVANAKVYDENGKNITSTKVDSIQYLIKPIGMAEYDATTKSIAILSEGAFNIIPVVYGWTLDPNPAYDTIAASAVGYKVGSVILPEIPSELHVGDTIKLDDAIVLDENGKPITDQVDDITYTIVPSDAVKYDPATDTYIVIKADSLQIIATVDGANLYPNPVKDTIEVPVVNYKESDITVTLPFKPSGEEYLPGDTIKLSDIVIKNSDGDDVTDLFDQKITWEPEDAAHLDKDGNLILDEYGDLDIKVEITGEGIDTITKDQPIVVAPIEVGEIIFPSNPADGYHVGDIINTDSIRVLDKDGKDVTDLAEITYVFEPTDGAHLDKDGNIVIDKSGNVVISAIVGGDVVEQASDDLEIFVKKYTTGTIILPSKPSDEDYEIGDKINKGDIQVLDKDGNDITNQANITITWEPDSLAHLDSKGNLVFDKAGSITVTTCVDGEGLTPKCVTETYIIRHNEDGCYNLLVAVWNNVLAINNNEEEHVKRGIPVFVNYQWYREEILLPGEVNQDYHISAGEINGEAYYYAYAFDATGKSYLMCQIKVDESSIPQASATFKVYPTVMNAAASYTIETTQAGKVYVSTNTGTLLETFDVNVGKNSVKAPSLTGVYVLQFVPANGAYEVQKIVVK